MKALTVASVLTGLVASGCGVGRAFDLGARVDGGGSVVADAGSGSEPVDAGPADAGSTVNAGVPTWVTQLEPGRWSGIDGTEFLSNATKVIPPDAYRGSGPLSAIVDAYGDPTFEPGSKRLHFHGGGHGDGTCNAIVTLDLTTLEYSLTAKPTPSSAYPPNYLIREPYYAYPSGLGLSWFHTLAQLSDPADQPFAAPFSAPVSTHQYGSQAVRFKPGGPLQIQYFYAQYKVFDLTAREWTDAHEHGNVIVPKVAEQSTRQYPDLGTHIGPDTVLQQGTMTVYDEVTDAYFVTLVAGDAGGGWRNYFFRYEPTTQTVSKIYRPAVSCRESMGWLKVGRWVYGFTSKYLPYPNMTIDTGFRFNIDTEAIEYFSLTGAIISYQLSSEQEAAPAAYLPKTNSIYTWNHNHTDRSGLYVLSLDRLGTSGGTGTADDPWVWPQTRLELGGSAPQHVSYKYNGLISVPEWDLLVVMPASDERLFAIKF